MKKQRYRVTGARPVLDHKPGEEFEHEFDESAEEASYLDAGRLELLPRAYRVIGTSGIDAGSPGDPAPPDEVFEAALPIELEQALLEAGHIERTTAKPTWPKASLSKQKGSD